MKFNNNINNNYNNNLKNQVRNTLLIIYKILFTINSLKKRKNYSFKNTIYNSCRFKKHLIYLKKVNLTKKNLFELKNISFNKKKLSTSKIQKFLSTAKNKKKGYYNNEIKRYI